MRVHQTAHQVHFNHCEHSWKREMRKSWDFEQWWRKEEMERQDVQDEPQATQLSSREKKRKHFWETGPRQYIILVERHPKGSCTKTHKQREYWLYPRPLHQRRLWRSVTFMSAWHNNHRWDVPSVRSSIWWRAQDKSSLRKTVLQSQTTTGQTLCQYSHALMMLAESPPRKMRIPQKMYKSHRHPKM